MKLLVTLLFFLASGFLWSQNISLYHQFNGRYDFTFIGNTMNPIENSFQNTPTIYTSSSANLSLLNTDLVEAAYLYWAGCGSGDFNVNLNSTALTAERTFMFQKTSGSVTFDYFSAFTNITSIVKSTGNATYTLSNLDVTAFIDQHFQIRTNFAGWAIVIVYKNNLLPLNQLNVYDGLQSIPIGQVTQPEIGLTITLNSLNVIDNNDAKIGFLAWEGDSGIAENESLRINGSLISNPPLNPSTNAFNGTNSFTNTSNLYNMDLDVYPIQNNIAIGDTSAVIKLTSGQDFVIINAVVTKLNSQLPDATIDNQSITQLCDSRKIVLNYQVKNFNATNALNAGTPIAFYADNQLIGQSITNTTIPIDGFLNQIITVTIPDNVPDNFVLKLAVDDVGNGAGTVTELIENNNSLSISMSLWFSPKFNILPDLISCNQGFSVGSFDFSTYFNLVNKDPLNQVTFYDNEIDANIEINPILNTSSYVAHTSPKKIYVKLKNQFCYSMTSFNLITKNCAPTVYNFITNTTISNSEFYIDGLRTIFVHFKLEIYNRWGRLIWVGNDSKPNWSGESDFGISVSNSKVADGTYYYILNLNDPNYPEPINGFLYFVTQ